MARFYLGYDPAKFNDRSGVVMVEKMDDSVLETRMILNLQGMDYRQQVPELIRICKEYKVLKLAIDATTHEALYEELRQALGYGRVEKIVFSKQTKEDLILNLRLVMMDNEIRFGRDFKFYQVLRKEMHDLDPDKLDHQKDGTSDLVWALALAVWASKQNYIKAKKIMFQFMERG